MADIQILLVEDDGLVAKDIQSILRRQGYSVSGVVAYGEEAIKKAEETSPDLVLMDIGLRGEMDGMEAAEYIREQLEIPVVYITSYGDEKTLELAEKTNPLSIIVKPCGEKEIHKSIELALSKYKSKSRSKEKVK
jgi:DNA-binding NarL/FixJ family response regulator